MLGSKCDFKMHVPNLGYSLPKKNYLFSTISHDKRICNIEYNVKKVCVCVCVHLRICQDARVAQIVTAAHTDL